jgi:hypothetical protein
MPRKKHIHTPIHAQKRTHVHTHTCIHTQPNTSPCSRSQGNSRAAGVTDARRGRQKGVQPWGRMLLPAMCMLALVSSAADSRDAQSQVEWLEQSNRALERDLASARAELLQRAARGFHNAPSDARDASGAATASGDAVVKKQLAAATQEVERLSAINHELKQLLVAGSGGGSNAGATARGEAAEEADADAAVREEMHRKVVGSAPKSKDEEMFLLDLAAAKLAEGDLGTAAGLYRSHLALFTGTDAGRGSAARRMLLLTEGHTRSRAGRHLAAEMVADSASAQVLLDIAGELEKGGLLAENRRAAAGLLELYLSHHSWVADVWHRLGLLRWRDGRLAEAVHCYQLASNLEPVHREYALSYAAANAELMAQPWLPPRVISVYVLQSAASNPSEASALAELQKALVVAGIHAVLVAAPARANKKGRRSAAKGEDGSSSQVARVGGQGQQGGAELGEGNVTRSLPVTQLQAGDVVVFPASRPPPAPWLHAARLRQVVLVSWLFSWRDLVSEGASSGLSAPPHPLWMDWDAGMVAQMMEGDVVKAAGTGGAAHVWTFRAAASHSVLWSSSAPAGALLIPPLPSLSHGADVHSHLGLMARDQDAWRGESHKHDVILCRGIRRKCLSAMHDTIRALPGSGFCPVPLATILDVASGSPAHDAGLAAGDLVLAAGLVAGGLRDVEQALQEEITHAKDHLLRVTVQRLKRAVVVSVDVSPQTWPAAGPGSDALVGWTLDFNPDVQCPDDDTHLFSVPGDISSRPRALKIVYTPENLSSEHMRSLLVAAKVLLRQFSWEGGSVGDSLGAVELEAALYDVCMLVPSDAAAAVDWPIASRLMFEPHVTADSMPALLLATVRDYHALSAERGVLKEYIKGLPAALSSASHLMVESSQHLFYTVALDVRDEAAACSLILSARLSHPLATVEVLVRDVQAFYHTHAALVLQLKEKGLWNGVWLSQIPATALEHLSASHQLSDAARLHVSLLMRPLSLHTGRSYHMACLVDPYLVMVPRAPHGLLDKLSGYSWSSAAYMAWASKGVMRLPMCFRPSALHARLTRATLSPPAGAEAAGKYLYRAMLGVAGFAMHKRLGDTNAIVSSLGAILPSLGSRDAAQLTSDQAQQLQVLTSHPAWAAAQPFLSADRKAAVRRALEGLQGREGVDGMCNEVQGLGEGGDGEVPEGGKHGTLEEEVAALKERVSALQQKLSEAKRLEQGWQEVAIATERQLLAMKVGKAEALDSGAPEAGKVQQQAREPNMPGAGAGMPSTRLTTLASKEGADRGVAVAGDARPVSSSEARVNVQKKASDVQGSGSSEGGRPPPVKAPGIGDEARSRATAGDEAVAAASTTKVVVLSGRAPAPYTDASAATPLDAPSGLLRGAASKPPQHSQLEHQQEHQRYEGVDEPQQGMHSEEQVRNATDQGISSSAPSSEHFSEPAAGVHSMAPPCGEELCRRNDRAAGGVEAGSRSPARSPVPSAAAAAASWPASEESCARGQEDREDARVGQPQEAPGVASVLEPFVGGMQEGTESGTREGNATAEAAEAGARRPRLDNATSDRGAAEDSAGFGMEKCNQGEAAAAGCGSLVDGNRQPLTAKERVLQAAIDRLAQEDAEEELRRSFANAQAQERGQGRGQGQQEDAVSCGRECEDASCPAGFVCSESVSVPMAFNHRSTPAAPAQADGSATVSPPPVDGPHQGPGSAEGGASDGGQHAARATSAEWQHEMHETPEALVENLEHAQEAARKRAEMLRQGRRMLTARNKMEDVAKRDEEVLRAARSKHEHPMFQRAVAAAAALRQPTPVKPAAPAPAPTAERGVRVAEAPRNFPVPNRSSSSPDGDKRVAPSALVHGSLPPDPEGSRDSGRGTEAMPATAPGAVKECGIGIGVGAAAHGTWKIKRVVPGDAVDRAVGRSSSTSLQSGDILTRVDGSLISGMSISELSKLVKGPRGSRVTLEFYSLLDSSLHTLTVDRDCE